MLVACTAAASAEDALLRSTTAPDDPLGPASPGSLRGSQPDPADGSGETAAEPVDPMAPEAPQGPVSPRGVIRAARAGQGSALLQPRTGAPQLPALQPYPTSQRLLRGAAVDTIDPTTAAGPPTVVGPTVAALPLSAAPRRRTAELDPYQPLGITAGTLRLTPYFEESLGYDSNPDQVSAGIRPSGFSRTEGGFGLLSLWSSNELTATMHAGYDAFFDNPQSNRPDAAGTVDYRYDVTRDIRLDSEVRFAVSTQRPGSPELNVAVQGRPVISSYGATIGGSDTFGRLTLGLHGLLDRTDYENGRLSNGQALALDTQDFTDYGLVARADYQLTPTLRPFGDVTIDTRVHDVTLDLSGYARDSDGIVGRIGTSFELTPLITGTVSAGYEQRSYDDRRLRDLRGPVVDASVIYAVTPLTTLTLLAATTFDETNLADSPGVESRSVSLQVSHALLRNLTLTALVGYLDTDYVASPIRENTYSATLKASYALSRSLVLEASYNHQSLRSTQAGSTFDQDIVLLGLRLQQ